MTFETLHRRQTIIAFIGNGMVNSAVLSV